MTNKNDQDQFQNPLNFLIDSFWASLPEKTADELSTFKKDVLTTVRDVVDKLIDTEIEWTNRHVENGKKMRDQYRRREAAEDSAPEAI